MFEQEKRGRQRWCPGSNSQAPKHGGEAFTSSPFPGVFPGGDTYPAPGRVPEIAAGAGAGPGGRAAATAPRCCRISPCKVSPGQVGNRFPLTRVPPKTLRSLTFMSLMMVWKSPPSALHSFSITASIFLARAHWRRQKLLQFHY